RAGIAEETLPGEISPLAEGLCQLTLRTGIPRIGNVNQLRDLLLHGRNNPRRAVPDQSTTPAGKEIEIAVALGVPDERAFAADQAHRVARVVRNYELLILRDRLCTGHNTISVPTPRSVYISRSKAWGN